MANYILSNTYEISAALHGAVALIDQSETEDSHPEIMAARTLIQKARTLVENIMAAADELKDYEYEDEAVAPF